MKEKKVECVSLSVPFKLLLVLHRGHDHVEIEIILKFLSRTLFCLLSGWLVGATVHNNKKDKRSKCVSPS